MGTTFHTTFPATRESIATAAEDLSAWLDAERIAEPAALLARLALDELATNLVLHAPGAGHSVHIDCRRADGEFVVQVEDDGPPFHPFDVPAPDLGQPLPERRIGGLGIHLLRELSDRFAYERVGERNRVTLVKHRDA